MAPFLYALQRYRFLLIVGGVVSTLFLAKTFVWTNPITLSSSGEIRAGGDGSLIINASANQEVNILITKPDESSFELKATTKEDGKAKVLLPGEELSMSGEYTAVAQQGYSKNASSETFNVLPGKASPTHSRVSFSQNALQKGQSAQMVIFLADEFGNPVTGHELSISPSQSSVQVYTSEFATDEKGKMDFSVSGSGAGVVSFSIFDATEGENILGQAQLAFTTANGDLPVSLAESGPVDAFELSGLESQTLASERQTVSVTAVDVNGNTVTDYTGTVRFSSTDSEAVLPDDYTFTADDLGEHQFSLSIKLISPGTQTLTLTDLDQTNVTGALSTKVVTTLDSTSTASDAYNSDFETTDFERDGDFTLISPASGSYSTSTIEVQGEGEYGNSAVVMLNDEEAGRTEIAFDNSFTYALQDLKDGSYDVKVNIVDKDGNVVETSDVETVTVDTTAPSLASISSDIQKDIPASSTVTVTVLSETGLESANLLFQDQITSMEETNTAGKYQAKLVMPSTEGTYPLDVVLSDALGNEAQYRDQLSLVVGPSTEPSTPTSTVSGVQKVTGLTATPGEENASLSWETPESENTIAYYRIYYGPSSDALFAISETYDSSTHWTIPGLVAGQAYYFAVTAIDVEGNESEQSEIALALPTVSSTPAVTNNTPPVISTVSTTAITQTPESGPATDALVILSAAAALTYVLLRKRARA